LADPETEFWWRITEDDYGEGQVVLRCDAYRVKRHTPCGVWLQDPLYFRRGKSERWVSKTARKRFAYPTKMLALESYRARKRRQIDYAKRTLLMARKALQMTEDWRTEEVIKTSMTFLYDNLIEVGDT